MRNRITIHIAGESYTMLAEEDEDYMQRVAALVDEKIIEARRVRGVSAMQSAVLAAVNLADAYYKASEAADNLRAQMKNYLEESDSLRRELAEAQRMLDDLTDPDGRRGGHTNR